MMAIGELLSKLNSFKNKNKPRNGIDLIYLNLVKVFHTDFTGSQDEDGSAENNYDTEKILARV